MGNAYASNVVNNVVEAFFNVMTNITQDCSTQMLASQILQIENSQNVVVNHVNFQQWFDIDLNCLQSSDTTVDIKNQIDQTIEQLSTAINQSLNLNPGSTTAQNIVNLITKIGYNISQTYLQDCSANLQGVQAIFIRKSSNILVQYVNFSQTINVMRSCVMNTNSLIALQNQLRQQISQTATAKVQGLLDGLLQMLAIILVIGAAIFFIFWKGGSILKNPLFIFSITLIILVLLIINYFLQWFPFKKVYNTDTSSTQDEKKKFNKTLLIIFLVLALINVFALVFFYWRSRKEKLESQVQSLSAGTESKTTPSGTSPSSSSSTPQLNSLDIEALSRLLIAA